MLAVPPVLAGKKHVVYGQEFPTGLRLTVDGQTCLFREEYDPTQLHSTIQGKLIRYLVGEGEHVSKDEPLPIEAEYGAHADGARAWSADAAQAGGIPPGGGRRGGNARTRRPGKGQAGNTLSR